MILKNALLTCLQPPSIQKRDIRIVDGKIAVVEKEIPNASNEQIIDLHGKMILPGFVCAHTHLYSSLARGMPPPKESPRNFLEILQKVWWRLDRALDEESIYYSALIGGMEAIQCGTTTLVDHHASPNTIDGSLDIIDDALGKIGIRRLLCYETTDRGGKEKRDAGLAENERFLKKQKDTLSAGIVGGHASFTLNDESLEKCADLANSMNSGIHIHVAEDGCDVDDARNQYGISIIERLEKVNLLHSKSLFAHNIHLSEAELLWAQKSGAWLLHNPRSNMNNAVGHASIEKFGNRAAIGTDGFPADMIEETKIAYFKNQDSRNGVSPQTIVAMLHQGNHLLSELFNLPFGSFTPGSAADLVILDYDSPTPMTDENLAGHFLFGLRSSMVESVMVNGEWIIFENEWQKLDIKELYAKALPVARRLWQKMEEID